MKKWTTHHRVELHFRADRQQPSSVLTGRVRESSTISTGGTTQTYIRLEPEGALGIATVHVFKVGGAPPLALITADEEYTSAVVSHYRRTHAGSDPVQLTLEEIGPDHRS